MRLRSVSTAAAVLVCTLTAVDFVKAQAPGRGGRGGGFVPGQTRPPEDPAAVSRGKTIYDVSCRACHGVDLRGGDIGGPNLLRSQLALGDKAGKAIVPVILGSRAPAMPAIPMPEADAKAVASFVRSVLELIKVQGMPPQTGMPAGSILVGDAAAGKVYFDSKCASCHSVSGDLKGIGSRITEPKAMQNLWVGGGRGGRGGAAVNERRMVTAAVTLPGGEKVEGRLTRIDDFLVTLTVADGSQRTIRRNGDVPKVEVRDPLKGHRDLLPIYTDKDMHNVTAYLVTVK